MQEIYVPEHLTHEDERILWILHAINWQTIYKHTERGAFVPLSSRILRKIVGREYVTVLTKAKKLYIETDNHFLLGLKCRGYRIRQTDSNWIPYQLTDRRLIGRLQKHHRAKVRDTREQIRGTSYATCVEDLKAVAMEPIDWENIDFPQKNKWTPDERKQRAQLKVQSIRDKKWFFSRDDYGRFHTNVTSLNNELTNYLRLGGEPVVSVDIVNSQPVFLAALLQKRIDISTKQEGEEERQWTDSITLYKSLRSRAVVAQLKTLRDIVCNGEFYERIAAFGECDRKTAKAQFFAYAYGPRYYKNKCRAWFEHTLPEIARLLGELKTHGDTSLTEAKRYKYLAREMQKSESQFIFGQVVPRISQELNTRLLTKHDSVLVPPQLSEAAKGIFVDEFRKLGIAGSVKVEDDHQIAAVAA